MNMGHLHLPHLPLLHHHHHHNNHPRSKELEAVPKGCLPVKVGQEGEEEERFVVPVVYVNHPLFLKLLKVAEEEYGFDQKGILRLPCHVAEFRNVRGLIDSEGGMATAAAASAHTHGHHHHHHHHLHNPLVDCFRA